MNDNAGSDSQPGSNPDRRAAPAPETAGRDGAAGPPRVLVAIATYNEMANLPQVVSDVQQAVPTADLLVVDDNSPDGTGKWVAEQAKSDGRIFAIHRPHKLGLGSATLAALRFAADRRYTYIVSLDGDGSHDPQQIPSMLQVMAQADETSPDVVIGSRYVTGGSTRGWPLHRRLMSRAVNGLARVMLGLPVRDCSGAFRCTRVAFLDRVDLASVRSQGYSLFEELLWRFKNASARFQEIPICFSNRTRGRSKINMRESISAIWMLLRLGTRNWFRWGEAAPKERRDSRQHGEDPE